MAKLKAPFLSLGATGTVGQALTVSRHKGLHVAKEVPTHPDARTLPQRYQRWRYYDSVQHWLSLSPAEQQAYRAPGSVLGRTAYQQHMSVYLKNPIDQVLWLRLDEQTGAVATDFSGKANHGTIVGALPVPGMIAGARWFDHINDYIDCGQDSTLDLIDELTIMAWVYLDNAPGFQRVVAKFQTGDPWHGYSIYKSPDNTWYLQGRVPGPILTAPANTPLALNTQTHIAASYDGAVARLYTNGIPDGELVQAGAFFPVALDLWLGRVQVAGQTWGGWEDDVRFYRRVLTPSHILAISRQRGP